MRPTTAVIAVASSLWATAASAHRIDEYLQATILSLQEDRIQALMRLVPGTLVADTVIAKIDSDHDGAFSDTEQQAYARRVLGDLSIGLNAGSVNAVLVSWSFPSPAEMRGGTGEIKIQYEVHLPDAGTDRVLMVTNHHMAGMSVYLINTVIPQDSHLHVVAQQRNERQSRYELDYQQTTPHRERGAKSISNRLRPFATGVLFTGGAFLAVLVGRRLRSRHPQPGRPSPSETPRPAASSSPC
jgi:hypothetical protein